MNEQEKKDTQDNISFGFLESNMFKEPEDGTFPTAEEVLEALREPGTIMEAVLLSDINNEEDEGKQISVQNIKIDIESRYGFTAVTVSGDIIELCSLLDEYEQMAGQPGPVAELQLMFMPEKYYGEAMYGCNAPVYWAPTSELLYSTADRMTFLFLPDNVGIFSFEVGKEEMPEL